MITKKCQTCDTAMLVRVADDARGWGLFCSKSCKAKKQTEVTKISGPDYRASGRSSAQMKVGHYAKSKIRKGIIPGKFCFECGDKATHGVVTNCNNGRDVNTDFDLFDESEQIEYSHRHGGYVEYTCDDHFDDSHPFEGLNESHG